MKLKDFLSKPTCNKHNGQLNTSFKKNTMKKTGISESDLMNMNIDVKLKRMFG